MFYSGRVGLRGLKLKGDEGFFCLEDLERKEIQRAAGFLSVGCSYIYYLFGVPIAEDLRLRRRRVGGGSCRLSIKCFFFLRFIL